MKLIKSYKPTHAALHLLTMVLVTVTVVVLIVTRQSTAQSCPFSPCSGDPCCGLGNCVPDSSSCQNAGWIYNFTNGQCTNPPTNSTTCDDIGMFWNFTSGVCQDNPPTQVVCQSVLAYWNFTNSTCGSSPAIGMCGGGADWTNYFTTGCWTSLGLYGGSLCDRSAQYKSKCYQFGGDYDLQYCNCIGCGSCSSPILIDVPGGFELTDVDNGVRFDLNGNGTPDRLSWTSASSTAAWLVLDRNRDGGINSAKELFGNFTVQTESPIGAEPNGFIALAEYDKPEHGGNNDKTISQSDDVFLKLRLWQDANHNGLSDVGELHGLWESGIETISLDYRESRHRDRYGNEFRYRAKITSSDDTKFSRWAYDVYLKGTQEVSKDYVVPR